MNLIKYNYQNRISYIDLFKGCGILLMIMGHVGFGHTFEKYIHAFHMPMFFFISGFLFKKKTMDFSNWIIKKFKSLILPYILWGVISLVVWYAFKGIDWKYFRILFWDNTSGIAISGALWFLMALFISDIIFFLVEYNVYNTFIKLIIYIFISSLGISLPLMGLTLPFAICSACVGTSFMAIGYYIKRNEIILRNFFKLNTIYIFSSFLIGSILVTFNETVNMRTSNYGNIFLFYTSSLLIILALLYYSRKIDKYLKICPLLVIGSDSITFVCLNQICIYAIGFLCNRFGLKWDGLFFDFLFLIIVLFILWIVNELIMRSNFKCLIGK